MKITLNKKQDVCKYIIYDQYGLYVNKMLNHNTTNNIYEAYISDNQGIVTILVKRLNDDKGIDNYYNFRAVQKRFYENNIKI